MSPSSSTKSSNNLLSSLKTILSLILNYNNLTMYIVQQFSRRPSSSLKRLLLNLQFVVILTLISGTHISSLKYLHACICFTTHATTLFLCGTMDRRNLIDLPTIICNSTEIGSDEKTKREILNTYTLLYACSLPLLPLGSLNMYLIYILVAVAPTPVAPFRRRHCA